MTPADYCQQKAAPIGSAFYYSVRKLTAAQRNAIIAVMAFYKEIETITLEYDDLSVAQLKLNWWRDEVIKLHESMPTHPIALRLKQLLPTLPFSPLQFMEIIDGLEQNLTLPTFEKFEDVVIHVMRTAGKREWLISSILLDTPIEPEIIYQLALVIELTNYIQLLRPYIARGLIYFAQDELQKFSVSAAELKAFKTTENIVNLLKFQADKIKTIYAQVHATLTPLQREKLTSMLIRCEISQATLRMLATSHFAVLENLINLTPIKLWWIAWRF